MNPFPGLGGAQLSKLLSRNVEKSPSGSPKSGLPRLASDLRPSGLMTATRSEPTRSFSFDARIAEASASGSSFMPAAQAGRPQPRLGPHSLMARRTFSLLGGPRSPGSLDNLELPGSHSQVEMDDPGLELPSRAVARQVTPGSFPGSVRSEDKAVGLLAPASAESTPRDHQSRRPSINELMPFRDREVRLRRPDSEGRLSQLRQNIGSRSALKETPDFVRPRSQPRHVHFAGDCKPAPPSSISDLLALVRSTSGGEDELCSDSGTIRRSSLTPTSGTRRRGSKCFPAMAVRIAA